MRKIGAIHHDTKAFLALSASELASGNWRINAGLQVPKGRTLASAEGPDTLVLKRANATRP